MSDQQAARALLIVFALLFAINAAATRGVLGLIDFAAALVFLAALAIDIHENGDDGGRS